MYTVNPGGRGVQQLAASVELEGAQPVKLHGGNLLAVGTSQQLKSGACSAKPVAVSDDVESLKGRASMTQSGLENSP